MRCLSLLIASAVAVASARAQSRSSSAPQVLDRAIDQMGGAALLRRVERVRFESMVQWMRQTFEHRPYGDVVGSFERISDWRDYTLPAWRNTRRFVSAAPTSLEIIDLVRDSAAARFAPQGPNSAASWAPLNIAYVDERRELFAFAAERLLLAARAASDLGALADTVIDATSYARVSATIDGFPTQLFLRRTDGFLAAARYRAAQPNDFGLAPFGAMTVETWYGGWRSLPFPGGGTITYPMQWDISRVGVPYKRITVLGVRFDIPTPADSFAISDELRRGFVVTASTPMWKVPYDSARIIQDRFAQFGQPGPTMPAVKLGARWILLEAAVVPERAESNLAWLRSVEPSARIGAAVVTMPGAVPGGIAWFTRQELPVFVGEGARRAAQLVLDNWKAPSRSLRVVETGRWIAFEGDSMWVEPLHVPGAPGGLLLWVPSLNWVYHAGAVAPLTVRLVQDIVRARGWPARWLGSARAVIAPFPAQPR
jgi:hypothetical protein